MPKVSQPHAIFSPKREIIHHCGQSDCCNFLMVNGYDLLYMANDQFYCGFCEEQYIKDMKSLSFPDDKDAIVSFKI